MVNNTQHFILTRFNLSIWCNDKDGRPVGTLEWLENRFSLFEKFCLSSIANQTCKEFEWIVLFDSKTPDQYVGRIREYQGKCPQMIPVFVTSEKGRYYERVFRKEVVERLKGKRVITTYLDNDDALDIHFVEDLRKRILNLEDGTFVYYLNGYQYFTEFGLLLRINYRRNHFVSVVETGDSKTVKSIYGYGSHYYIDKIPGVRIEYVKGAPLWCEVIHERNMGNDAYFLFGTKTVRDDETLHRDFAIDDSSRFSTSTYLLKFIPRYIKTFFRRVGYSVFGRKWLIINHG